MLILWKDVFKRSIYLAFQNQDTDPKAVYDLGTNIYDEQIAVVPAISFCPSQLTGFRVNYRYQWDGICWVIRQAG